MLSALSLLAQTGGAPTFDVISIRSMPPGEIANLESDCAGGGRLISRGSPLLWTIKWAYGIDDYQLTDGWPGWLNSRGVYNVEATSEARVTEGQCKAMVRSLFEDRFHLRMHHGTKVMSAYALVAAKNGPKLAPRGKVIINGAVKQASSEPEAPEGWTMARLANYLADVRGVERPVIDRTGLAGMFSFKLNYSTKDGDDRPDIFNAVQQQLGLKLQPVKAPIEMWTIDHVERPSGN